jgi:DNA-binding PadR family transcriptional regulator
MRHVVNSHIPPSLPISESVLLILLSLSAEPRHGYAILKDVEQLSNGRVKMSTGTLYGALRRLLEDGWIERIVEEDATRDRQSYRLTRSGTAVLTAEVGRMKELARVATQRMTPKRA